MIHPLKSDLRSMKGPGRRVSVGPRTKVVHQTVGVEETFLGVKSLLGLQSDLDHVQWSHEQRHH